MRLTVNGTDREIDAEPQMPLLWALRDLLGLNGTKYGCGIGVCGACTVLIDGRAVQSCSVTLSEAEGAAVTTIEGLGQPGALHPIQQAWIAHQVAQCGYCQPGQIMATAGLLAANPSPSDAEIDAALSLNLCRCGTYPRLRAAVHEAARRLRDGTP